MRNRRWDGEDDGGFTLIEVLLVTVVLGVLSSIVVFAVRGIVDQGDESACASDLRTLVTAQEAYAARSADAIATEADLVAAGLLVAESELWDVTVAGDEFTVAPAPAGGCSGGTSG